MKTYLYRASNLISTIHTGLHFIAEVNTWRPPQNCCFLRFILIIQCGSTLYVSLAEPYPLSNHIRGNRDGTHYHITCMLDFNLCAL